MQNDSQTPTCGRGSLRTFQQFSTKIQAVVAPKHFRESAMTVYDGSNDPHDHVVIFQSQMFIIIRDEAINCKMFSRKLKNAVLRWFIGLPLRSITNFEDLDGSFTTNFSAVYFLQE